MFCLIGFNGCLWFYDVIMIFIGYNGFIFYKYEICFVNKIISNIFIILLKLC